ncbi:MAG: (d)CMP kinase [Cytophagales bacterium]|nr:MAG: (d)CMP kinase [Cytophagales bacterium]
MDAKIIIAIDGYAACGKSTTAKMVAQHLHYNYIDSGAMYRAVTLFFIQQKINYQQEIPQIEEILSQINIHFGYNAALQKSETFLNEVNVENEIRKMYVSEQVSPISAIPAIRKAMVTQQQKLGQAKGIVMDGRDIGTHVFPEAELKIFMTADMHIRALRRQKELEERKEIGTLEQIIKNLEERDYQDTHRKENPLKQAQDAYLLDNTQLSFEEQCQFILQLAEEKIRQKQQLSYIQN